MVREISLSGLPFPIQINYLCLKYFKWSANQKSLGITALIESKVLVASVRYRILPEALFGPLSMLEPTFPDTVCYLKVGKFLGNLSVTIPPN